MELTPSFVEFVPPDQKSGGGLPTPVPAGFRFGYGLTDEIDIESELTAASIPDFYASLGLRYQWLGESALKAKQNDWTSVAQLKLIYGAGEETGEDKISSSTEGDTIQRHLVGHGFGAGFSLSNSFGYTVRDWFTIYGGGEIIYLYANYEVEVSTKSKNIEEKRETDDNLWIYGPFAGIQLNTTGPHWMLVFALEGSLMYHPVATGWNKEKKWQLQPGLASSIKVLLPF